MGKTADLAMVQKMIIHRGSLLKGVAVQGVLYQSILNVKLTGRKKLGRKMCTSNRNGRKLEKSPHAQTSSGKGLPSHFWNRNIIRSILPGPRRKRTELSLGGPKSSFQIKVHFAFHLEISESGRREERHRIHVVWSPVWSFHSQWWFGLPCHLLVLVHCVFWSPQPNAAIYQEILEHFMLYGDADFIFQQDLAPAHTAKGIKSWFNDHGVTVLDWPAHSPDLNPVENLYNTDDLKAAIKATWASITPEQCHKLIASMPRQYFFLKPSQTTCGDVGAVWQFV